MRAFVGFGELGRQIDAFLRAAHGDDAAVYFDDVLHAAGAADARQFSAYDENGYAQCDFFICLGYHHLPARASIIASLQRAGRNMPPFVHGTSYISSTATIGDAAFIYPLCVVDKGVTIGAGALLNNAVTVSHDSVVGESCYLSPGVTVCGEVTIGSCSFIGAGAMIADGVAIGENVTVGIGTVVTADIPSNASVIGNPMRRLVKPLRI